LKLIRIPISFKGQARLVLQLHVHISVVLQIHLQVGTNDDVSKLATHRNVSPEVCNLATTSPIRLRKGFWGLHWCERSLIHAPVHIGRSWDRSQRVTCRW
jgi:hypothetical protein